MSGMITTELIREYAAQLQKSRRAAAGFTVIFAFALSLALEASSIGAGIPFGIMNAFSLGMGILIAVALLYCLSGSLFASGLVIALPLTILYIVNIYRFTMTGLVFTSADLRAVNQLGNILSFTTLEIKPGVVLLVISVILILSVLLFLSKNFKYTLRQRFGAFSASLAAMLVLVTVLAPAVRVGEMETANSTYRKYGTGLAFLSIAAGNYDGNILPSIGSSYIERVTPVFHSLYEPAGVHETSIPTYSISELPYSRDLMTILTEEVKSKTTAVTSAGEAVKPNVIVIMSEAFSDPTLWPNLTFSEDPLPNLRKLSETSQSGNIITPVFGGGTCNTEFELLTGNSMMYAGLGHTPYELPNIYFDREDMRSLPNIFKQNGYTAVGVHTYLGDFFNRRELYPKLGFDKFVAAEDMDEDAPLKGKFISDEYFTDKMIEEIEAASEPLFLFGISMQNHYEYYTNKFGDDYNLITVESDLLDEEEIGAVASYANGVYDADMQLGRLIEYVEASGEPTLIFFFGDHLPLMGKSALGIFNKLGYITSSSTDTSDLSPEDTKKAFSTQYVMWSNFETEYELKVDMSAYYIGASILEVAGLPKNLYFEFLSQSVDKMPVARQGLFIGEDGEISGMPDDSHEQILFRMKSFQKDHIGGEHYADEELSVLFGADGEASE